MPATTPDPETSLKRADADELPDLRQVALSRELFWQNVVREMLTALSVMQATHPELFDGRTAVLTRDGSRIPIGEVWPLFACGIPGTSLERAVSVAVECTTFRIVTPEGEVFTLPLNEIRSIHSLSPDLVKRLEQDSMQRSDALGVPPGPFGFAAFTTAGRGVKVPIPGEGAD
jgi:hypothetical protein